MNLFDSTRNWFSRRRTLGQLHALSNETLQDIGLTRFDVNRAADNSFFRGPKL